MCSLSIYRVIPSKKIFQIPPTLSLQYATITLMSEKAAVKKSFFPLLAVVIGALGIGLLTTTLDGCSNPTGGTTEIPGPTRPGTGEEDEKPDENGFDKYGIHVGADGVDGTNELWDWNGWNQAGTHIGTDEIDGTNRTWNWRGENRAGQAQTGTPAYKNWYNTLTQQKKDQYDPPKPEETGTELPPDLDEFGFDDAGYFYENNKNTGFMYDREGLTKDRSRVPLCDFDGDDFDDITHLYGHYQTGTEFHNGYNYLWLDKNGFPKLAPIAEKIMCPRGYMTNNDMAQSTAIIAQEDFGEQIDAIRAMVDDSTPDKDGKSVKNCKNDDLKSDIIRTCRNLDRTVDRKNEFVAGGTMLGGGGGGRMCKKT
jgi:hypothetical protein